MASDTGKEANDDDRISKLPDSILSLILSSLPMKDAVSTSILSTRWRYLFVSMFNLDVNFYIFRPPPPPHIVQSFTDFMEEMLFLHTEGNIQRFRLRYIHISGLDSSRVCGWICAALWREVKEIHLDFTSLYDNFPKLPTALLFTSKTLKILKLVNLHVMGTMGVPINVCLPCLNCI
ncbi:hypothetical protein like AT3G59200 [Hibiscus trionum]|uniref:F-box domain-containing protein n=1 Tax=Hibiscus trionum TaxID=183268 RepID=A0A9W7GQ82_HIBTR|nr:hypothetical protein like AT3G59200 [Hibiscus trionum]